MYKELTLFRNELKNNRIPQYKIIGIVSVLIFSREIFKKNSEIYSFLNEVFDLQFKEYIMKSRTLIIARTTKMIHNIQEEEYNLYKKRLLAFVTNKIEELKRQENIKAEKNQFDGWLSNIHEKRHDI